MTAVKISVMLIMWLKYLKDSGIVAILCAYLDKRFLTEFMNMVLVVTNIIENITKIERLNGREGSTPVYEENFTMDVSNTTIVVKTKMKISEFFLVRFKVV